MIVKEGRLNLLETSAAGKLLDYKDTQTLQDLFISHGIWDAHIRSMGGLQVLLSFDSKDSLSSFLKDESKCPSKWFDSVEVWNKQRVKPSRCTWISCFGVPLHVWNSQTFVNIGKLWGETIKIDELTAKSLAFDKGRIFILTYHLECINEVVNLKVKGDVFPIKVAEDPMAETSWECRVVTIIKVKKDRNQVNPDEYHAVAESDGESFSSVDVAGMRRKKTSVERSLTWKKKGVIRMTKNLILSK